MPIGDGDAVGALDGVRVLDLTSGSFGYAGRMLAGLGADVVKIEPPAGDEVRDWPPFAGDEPGPERSLRHLHLNAAKRSVVLDLDTSSGRDTFRGLVRAADAILESHAPGALADLGLGYDELLVERGDLVMASLSHFGQAGPRAGDQGAEIVDAAIGGYLRLTGDRDREPVKPFDDLVIQHAALHAATAVTTGLFERDRSGRGDWFDVSVADAALFMLGGALQTYAVNGEINVRNGARLLRTDPTAPYPSTLRPCRDGWVHAHLNYRHPDLLAVMMEDPAIDELLDLPTGNADAIDEHMDRWLADHDRAEVVQRAQDLRVPFTEVFSPAEVLNDPHLAERGFFVELEYPELGTITQPGAPVQLGVTPWRSGRAPSLGEHTNDVLREWTESGAVP
jgi:crotonobetainyl-CoA:carnitine CoA-transferase CaiB-like acyl-CoA transferase